MDLVDFLANKNVIDMKLIPDIEMKTILVRVLIYPNYGTSKINPEQLLSKICEFANFDELDKCQAQKWLDKVKRVRITGLENFTSEEEIDANEHEAYRFEAYKITL